MAFVELIQNDEATVPFPLSDASGNRLDLTGDTVRIRVYYLGNSSESNQSAGVLSGVDGVEVTNYVNRSRGIVSYTFDSGDLAWQGKYYAQFEVDDGTNPQWYPKGDPFSIKVRKRYGATPASTISSLGTLTGSLDAGGNDITGIDVLGASTLRSRDTGDTIDVDSVISGGGGSGVSVALDLGNDDNLESSGINEIATTGDANNIATEPSPGKLLMDMGQNWPVADAVPTDAIGTTELNLAIAPTWTGLHTFGAGVSIGSSGSTPSQGQFTYDGTDVYVGTGGTTKSLSDVGTGSGGSSKKSCNIRATNYGTNSGALQVIQVIPASLISEVTALYSTLYDSNGDIAGTNGSFKIRIYDGQANIGSTDTADFVRWNAGERFTSSPPYLTLTGGNDAVLALENDTGGNQRVSLGFEYE